MGATHAALVTSVCAFNPLCTQISLNQAAAFDSAYIRSHLASLKHHQKHPKHLIFLPPKILGMGHRALFQATLQGIARELDVHLNSASHTTPFLHSRIQAMHNDPMMAHTNYTLTSIHTLAMQGYHLRQTQHPILNNIMEHLLQQSHPHTGLGVKREIPTQAHTNPFTIQEHPCHIPYTLGSPLHTHVQQLLSPFHNPHMHPHHWKKHAPPTIPETHLLKAAK